MFLNPLFCDFICEQNAKKYAGISASILSVKNNMR